jgi:iron complex transport system permease protein
MHSRSRPFVINLALLVVAVLLSIGVGSVFIPPAMVVRMLAHSLPGITIKPDWPEAFASILFQIRLPHTALMLLTGAALGGSGAAYQGLFRNPLADPYLIGVASGAALGAVFALTIGWPTDMLGLYTLPASAFLGAALSIAIVYGLARIGRAVPTTTLILAGVAFSAFSTSLMSFLMLRAQTELRRALTWLLGGATMAGWEPVMAMLPYELIGLGILIACGHALNVLQFGEEQAVQLGLPIERIKLLVILAASVSTAGAVAFAGIIGFIGLIAPHVTRLLWGPDYRRLIPLSILSGSSALLVADMLSRIVLSPQTLPVGIVTALAGAPFFLWILRRARTQAYW